jgi:hypothetical protein
MLPGKKLDPSDRYAASSLGRALKRVDILEFVEREDDCNWNYGAGSTAAC